MIINKVSNAVQPLVDEYDANGFAIKPRPGTLLERIVKSMYSPDFDTRGVSSALGAVVAVSGKANDFGEYETGALLSEAAGITGSTLSAMMTHARGVFAPMAGDVLDQVEKRLSDVAERAHRHSVEIVHLNPIFNNEVLMSMTERFAESTPTSYKHAGAFPDILPSDLLDRLMTGIERLDRDIDIFFDEIGSNTALKLYNHVLNGLPMPEETTEINASLFRFLLGRNLQENVLENVNLSLDDYRIFCSSMMVRGAVELTAAQRKVENEFERKRMVLSFPKPNDFSTPIRVNGALYKKWIEEGGSTDILMGCALVGGDFTYGKLLEYAEKHKATYARHKRFSDMRFENNRVSEIVAGVSRVMRKEIREGDPSFKDSAEVMLQRLDAAMEKYTLTSKGCVKTYVHRIVHVAMYPQTRSFEIAEQIDALCKADPTLTPREAATDVGMDILAEHIASQIVPAE